MTAPLPNPFMIAAPDCGKSTSSRVVAADQPSRFVLDEAKFEAALREPDEPPPLFLRDPSPDFINAAFMQPLLDVLNKN